MMDVVDETGPIHGRELQGSRGAVEFRRAHRQNERYQGEDRG